MAARLYDVIVVGGGTAGVIAGVQAARAGARTLLVEKNGVLGGTMTVAGVDYPGCFHAWWGEQLIAGIGWELAVECARLAGDPLPAFTRVDRCGKHQFRANKALYAALCDQRLADTGAEVLLHTMVADVKRRSGAWRVTLCTRTGLVQERCRQLVDCTGDALVAAMAGARLARPRVAQPATLVAQVSGYDPAALDTDSLNRAFAAAVGRGELKASDACWDERAPTVSGWLWNHGGNSGHVPHGEVCTSRGRTTLEVESRAAFLRLYRFLKAQPGLAGLKVESLAPESGVRESVTIVGRRRVTLDDYVGGRCFDDALCYSFYAVDLHQLNGTDYRMLPEGARPTIPAGSMLPRGVENLVVAGRCIASDRLANSALRVQATCMATGQAAGAMAALAAVRRTSPARLPLADIRALLREHGAIVPEPAGPRGGP